jgi:P27 family predicted phage terminase small subunit
MKRRGRHKKPVELKILEGTFRRDRDGDPDAPVAGGEALMPKSLKGDARKFWQAYVPDLISRGLARTVDTPALTAMCEWWARYRRYAAALDKTRANLKGGQGILTRCVMASKQFEGLATRFGLTPCDRAKLRADAGTVRPRVESRKREA